MPRIAFRRAVRQRWAGPAAGQVVILAAIHEDDDTITGEVWASVGNKAALVQQERGVTADAKRRTITTADGTVWSGPAPSCGCSVPKALKGFDPVAAR